MKLTDLEKKAAFSYIESVCGDAIVEVLAKDPHTTIQTIKKLDEIGVIYENHNGIKFVIKEADQKKSAIQKAFDGYIRKIQAYLIFLEKPQDIKTILSAFNTIEKYCENKFDTRYAISLLTAIKTYQDSGHGLPDSHALDPQTTSAIGLLLNYCSVPKVIIDHQNYTDLINTVYDMVDKKIMMLEKKTSELPLHSPEFLEQEKKRVASDFDRIINNNSQSSSYQLLKELTSFSSKLEKEFLSAASTGNLERLSMLLPQLSKPITEIIDERSGANALHLASNNGHLDAAKQLVTHSPELLDTIMFNMATPLCNAIENSHGNIVTFLLAEGAKITPKTLSAAAKKNNMTPLLTKHLDELNNQLIDAINNKNADKLKIVLGKGADVNLPIPYVNRTLTPLLYAVWLHSTESIPVLLNSGAHYDATLDHLTEYTAFHTAAFFGFVDILPLLSPYDSLINKTDKDGNTALHIAIREKHYETIDYLLSLPEIDTTILNKAQESPHDIANALDDEKLIALLNKYHTNVSQEVKEEVFVNLLRSL